LTFHVLTIFPEMFSALEHSIIRRAKDAGFISINYVNIRDFSADRHRRVDDYPYGGGAGMVMSAQPIFDAYASIGAQNARVCYLSPGGRVFDHAGAVQMAKEPEIILLCGHYEGVDQRVIDAIVTDEISIGDFVLSGGEIAAMAVIDAVSRQVAGVIKEGSLAQESFSAGLLEYPQYTRPYEFLGRQVPEVLISGHHENIEKWRKERAFERTQKMRPDLLIGINHE